MFHPIVQTTPEGLQIWNFTRVVGLPRQLQLQILSSTLTNFGSTGGGVELGVSHWLSKRLLHLAALMCCSWEEQSAIMSSLCRCSIGPDFCQMTATALTPLRPPVLAPGLCWLVPNPLIMYSWICHSSARREFQLAVAWLESWCASILLCSVLFCSLRLVSVMSTCVWVEYLILRLLYEQSAWWSSYWTTA